MNNDKLVKDIVSIVRRVGPYVPALIAIHRMSSKTKQNGGENHDKKCLGFLLDENYSLLTLLSISGLFLSWMRDSTIDDIKEEAKNFSFIDKIKSHESPFLIELINGDKEAFTHVDNLTEFIGAIYVGSTLDRASRSFLAAKKSVIHGWVDPYFMRVSEFICIRSFEQLLHEFYKKYSDLPDWVISIEKNKNKLTNDNGMMIYLGDKFGHAIDIKGTVDKLIKIRESFAHREDPSYEVSPLRLAPFQLVSALLEYRDSKQ